MTYVRSYKWFNRLVQDESFEPMISWGIRMAFAGTLPVLWGLTTGKISDAIWLTLAAESVSWVELKGEFLWRLRTLIVGALLVMVSGVLGTVTGNFIWLSVVCMFGAGFVATLLKNIGDRASGLGLCVYLMFIISNAYPLREYHAIEHRVFLLCIGAAWPLLVGMIVTVFMPAKQPFRRQIAVIWRAIAALADTVSRIDNRPGFTTTLANVYVKEREVRSAIDSSYQFNSEMSHQANDKDNLQYQLVMQRKVASLVAVNVVAIGDEMARIRIQELDKTLRIKAGTLFNALREAITRISVFTINLEPEEKLLARSQINRLKRLVVLIREYPLQADDDQAKAISRILQLAERTIKLLENAILRIEQMGKDAPVFRSYSFIKTLFILRPRHLFSDLSMLFNISSQTFRYALRSAIAVTIALFIYKWYRIDHGYWLPFSVMIIIQPYFGATFKKAIDRIVGTLLGGLAGSLLLFLPASLHIHEVILFLTFIFMVYYLRRNYAVAAFVITLNLVLLFNIESSYNNMLMVTRAVCTIGGALLAVGAGWALLPTWDKKWLPSHLAGAVHANYEYFIATFYVPQRVTAWTRYKRIAESKNSNVFDSFNRYLQEPGREKSEEYYDLITCSVRITRNLNNIHTEQDEKKQYQGETATLQQQQRIDDCLELFNSIVDNLSNISPGFVSITHKPQNTVTPFLLNDAQLVSLEQIIIELKTMKQEMK